MKIRNCADIIFEILLLIPRENEEFRKDLMWNFNDSKYKPPEETIQWIRTQETLERHIPWPPKEEWQFKILSIFTTKSIEEIKNEIN